GLRHRVVRGRLGPLRDPPLAIGRALARGQQGRSRRARDPCPARARQAKPSPPPARSPRLGDLRRLEAPDLGAAMAHPDIAAEQVYLDHAYESLERMRQALLRTVGAAGIGAEGADIAVSRVEAWVDRRLATYERAEEILCFGRIDVNSVTDPIYVGR